MVETYEKEIVTKMLLKIELVILLPNAFCMADGNKRKTEILSTAPATP